MAEELDRQQRALEKAKQVLLDAEKKKQMQLVDQQLREFADGNNDLLKQPSFADNLGQYLFQLYQNGQRKEVIELIDLIGHCSVDEDSELRQKAVSILTKLSGYILGTNDYEIFKIIFNNFVNWIEKEENYIDGFGVACSQLHKITQRLFEDKKYWRETEQLLVALDQIQNGLIEKSSTIRGMVAKLQESLATKNILELLVLCYLTEKSAMRNTAETLLTNLGRRSVVYLLNRLMHSEEKEERLQLVKLIPGVGNVVVPVMVECLHKKPPWYVIRNVIFIISEFNNSSLYTIVKPYLSHRDIRVQQQVLSCIVKISGSKLKQRLIEALPRVKDDLKMQIIMQIGNMRGEDVSEALLELLNSRESFAEETYIELLVKICVALKFFPTKNVIDALKYLIEERKKTTGPTDPVIVAARDTLFTLEPKYRHGEPSEDGEFDQFDGEVKVYREKTGPKTIRKIEQSIKELVAQGDLEKAGSKLFANAVTAAKDKDFNSAELLRDKLLEINPLALSEVIRLGEIIEEERSSSINNHHIALWSDLYEKMTTEEFNALYYALRIENFRMDEPIVKAGETDPSLYFVNSGLVRLSCQCDNRETFLKRLQSGEVVGVGPFFSVSVWTVSMTAQTETQIHVLTREKFSELKKIFPDLESKLLDFCNKHDTVPELLRMSGSDRREAPRYSISVIISNTLLDPYGNAGKRSFRGELIDISKGGLCFSIHISSRDNARMLLGRQIVSGIDLGNNNLLKCFGVIVAVKYQEVVVQEFSVHVKFFRELEQQEIKKVVNLEM